MAVLSPYRPKWRSEAHFELKSDVLDTKSARDAIWTTPSPKLLLLCMLLPKSNMRTERASFECRLGPQFIFLVLNPVHIKKLDVLHYSILTISKWI